MNKRILILEKGKRELTQIEKILFKVEDSFKKYNYLGKFLFNYKSNGKLEKNGKKYCVKSRVKVSPELIQDMQSFYYKNSEEELNVILIEQFENEIIQRLLNIISTNKTNIKSILIEKNKVYKQEVDDVLVIKNLFNQIIKTHNPEEYSIIISPEIMNLTNFIITDDTYEKERYCLGFEKYGYIKTKNFFKSKNKRMKVYINPYSKFNECIVVKNLRSPEFFLSLNTEELSFNINDFIHSYSNHEIHFNIPDDMSYNVYNLDFLNKNINLL